MFGLNEGFNQFTGMEFRIRMLLGILGESSFRKALLCIAGRRCVTRAESKK